MVQKMIKSTPGCNLGEIFMKYRKTEVFIQLFILTDFGNCIDNLVVMKLNHLAGVFFRNGIFFTLLCFLAVLDFGSVGDLFV